MAGYNRIILLGNLTRDPEYKQLSSGQAVCRLGLASNRQFNNRQSGSMVQEVCYIDVDVWGAQAESCRQFLQKGRQVMVEGRIKFDQWEDGQGQKRSKHSIVADRVIFFGSGKDSETEMSAPLTANAGAARLDTIPQEMEKDLLNQIANVKQRTNKAAAKQSSAPDTGEIDYKDEQPFIEDLPF